MENLGLDYKVRLITGDFTEKHEEFNNIMEEHETKIMEEHLSMIKNNVSEIKEKSIEKIASSKSEEIIFGREIKGETISINNFSELIKNEVCIVEGEVFSVDKRATSTGKQLFIFSMTDYKDSITIKFFRLNSYFLPPCLYGLAIFNLCFLILS